MLRKASSILLKPMVYISGQAKALQNTVGSILVENNGYAKVMVL
jgi:hypothetical protein